MKQQAARRIFIILFIAIFAAMLGLGIIGPLMPIYAKNLGATGIWLGVIFSGFSLSRAIFMPIIGRISDRKGRKKFIVVGLFCYSVISLLYIQASNVWALSAIRFLHGFASAMVIPIVMAYIGESSRKGHEGKRMGIFNIAFFLGMGSGPLLGGLIHDKLGFNAVFHTMTALTAFAFLLTLIFLPDVNINIERENHGKKHTMSIKKIFSTNIFKGLLIYRFINAMGRGGVLSFFPVLAAYLNISPSKIGLILTTNIFLMALLQGIFGYLADKWNKFYMVIIGSIIGSLALILISLVKNFWSFLLLALVMGLGGAISMPAATAINVRIGRRYGMGSSMGLFNTAMSIGMIIAPIISGLVMDYFGLKYIFYVSGGISLIGTFIFSYYLLIGQKSEVGQFYAN